MYVYIGPHIPIDVINGIYIYIYIYVYIGPHIPIDVINGIYIYIYIPFITSIGMWDLKTGMQKV